MMTIPTESAEGELLSLEVSPLPTPAKEPGEKISHIPDRMFFRIGDVAEIAGLQPYVLRFWEKEFEFLAPIKNSSGQRLYRKSDVECVLLIKRLLYKERYSIEGAKKRIKGMRRNGELAEAKRERGALDEKKVECLQEIREGLQEILDLCQGATNHRR